MRPLNVLGCSIAVIVTYFCNAQIPLETLRQYSTGLYSTGVITADVDDDGDLDIIIANRGTDDVTVLYNNGIGLFPTSLNFPTGSNPRYVNGADFDGDGDFDLCTPDYTGSTTTVLENDGIGSYSILAQYPMTSAAFLWVDDIDDDGHADILVLQWDENATQPSQKPAKFTPLLNNGDGSFIEGPSSWIGAQPRGGDSADLNGDGLRDVVTANYNSQTLSIVLAVGPRQWADEVPIQLSGQPRYLVLEDLDDDGDIDIAAIDKGEDHLWIFHNDGKAHFTLVETSSTSNIPHSIDAGDIDLDGDIDLVVSHVGSSQHLLFMNDGNGFFPTSQTVIMTAGPADIKMADINNDGDLDLVTANVNWEDRGTSVLFQGDCSGDDCNANGIGDICELPDCNVNGVPDECDISTGLSLDFDGDGVPDECQADCNGNAIPDQFEIDTGLATDCNNNNLPDDCDWVLFADCDGDGTIDACEPDINEDWIPDDCQCIADVSGDLTVSVVDLLQLIAVWGEGEPHGEILEEDLNTDGTINIDDLLVLISAWGDCSEFTIPDVTGACCLTQYWCDEYAEVACGVRRGTYMGDNTTCLEVDCSNP